MAFTRNFRFDLVDVSLFINISEANSLSAGAERSNLSLAATSMRIKNLEINLGAQLFHRTSRGVTLTSAGQTFLHHGRLVMQQLEHMTVELQAYTKGVKGHLRIAANLSAQTDILPGPIRSFLVSHPGVEVELKKFASEEGVRAVSEGAVDIALVSGHVAASNLDVVSIRTERFVLITPFEHPLATRAVVSFEDILDHELVGLGEGVPHHSLFSRISREVNKPLNFRIHVNNFEDLCRLVSESIGVAAIPESAAHKYDGTIPFRIIPISDPWALREMKICVRTPRTLPDFVYELAALIRESAAQGNGARH
jgi:DNA-binding transcriptional LysR family regulator